MKRDIQLTCRDIRSDLYVKNKPYELPCQVVINLFDEYFQDLNQGLNIVEVAYI
jgi:hypothetical protein